ncbi:unnamed protein product, partial [Discosporangium mesarthrocarpum]
VHPGCHAPGLAEIRAANVAEGHYGTLEHQCLEDADCYGAGECVDVGATGHPSCVCPSWSPRELHGVAFHGGFIYVVGGFVSIRRSSCGSYACGDSDAGATRGYASDVWVSGDGGGSWAAVTLRAPWGGRGDHGLFVYAGVAYVVGGAAESEDGGAEYLNDVWYASLPPARWWYNNITAPMWEGRGGHQVVVEVPAAINAFTPRVYIICGHNRRGVLEDTWSWDLNPATPWFRDYSRRQPFRTAATGSSGFISGPGPQV